MAKLAFKTSHLKKADVNGDSAVEEPELRCLKKRRKADSSEMVFTAPISQLN